jgi:hypothetical protein
MDAALARSLREKLDASGKNCPDAALLAAYFDRALPPDEAARWEAHFSACARCQEQLAVLARTEPALAETSAAAEPGVFRRFWTARWLAPLATAAAAVALWVVVRPTPPVPATPPLSDMSQPSVERPQPAAAVPDATLAGKSVGPAQAGKDATRDKSDAITRGAYAQRAEGKLQSAAPEPKKPSQCDELPASGARDRVPAVAAERKAEETEVQTRAAQIPAPASQSQMPRPASQPADQAAGQKETEIAAAQAPPVGRMDPAVRRNEALPARTAESDSAEKRRATAPPGAPPRQEEVLPAEKSASSELRKKQIESQSIREGMLAFRSPQIVATAPGGKIVWRFGPGGLIEKSSNAGKTWTRQASPVAADLRAGSAPSADVCWAVGTAGTILRTADGEKWEKIAAPAEMALQAVSARDADNASVTTADGRTFVTSDGGRTWRQK